MIETDHIHILVGVFGVIAVIGAAWWMHIDLSEVIRTLRAMNQPARA